MCESSKLLPKLSTVTYPGANYAINGPTVTYTYDAMSRLLGASDVEGNATTGCGSTPPGGTVTWAQSAAYTPAGQLGALTRLYGGSANCSGISSSSFGEVWYFNNLSQTTEIDVSGIPGFPQPYLARYYYNSTQDNGQITSMDDGRLNYNIAYQYDALKRLATATAAGHWTQSYSYDGFGNLTAKSVPSGSAEPSFPGVNSAKNWLTGVTYDANGNTTTGIGNQTLSYDIENRLIQSAVGSASTTYGYDESNHRIVKTMGSNNPIVFFYDPDGKLMASFAATSLGLQLPNYRIYFGGMLLGTTSGSAPSEGSALADRLGTYNPGYPYGTDAMSGASDDAPDFATYTKDGASGFEYANQRYYSPGYGKFLTTDPYEGSSRVTNPASWNKYAYVLGDPANANDPSGRCSYGQAECGSCPEGDPACSCPDGVCTCDAGMIFNPETGLCDPPPAPSTPTVQPVCMIELWERPVPFRGSPGNHTYIEAITPEGVVTPTDPSGDGADECLEGKPAGFPIGSPLIGVISPVGSCLGSSIPNNPIASNPNLPSNHEIGSPDTSPYACTQISEMETAILAYNLHPATYTFLGILAYNSNSFTYTLLTQFGISFGNPTGWVPGWNKLVPGL